MKKLKSIPKKIGTQFLIIHEYKNKLWSKTIRIVSSSKSVYEYEEYDSIRDQWNYTSVNHFHDKNLKFYNIDDKN